MDRVKKLVCALGDIVAELEELLDLDEDAMDCVDVDSDPDDSDCGGAAASCLKGLSASTTRLSRMLPMRD